MVSGDRLGQKSSAVWTMDVNPFKPVSRRHTMATAEDFTITVYNDLNDELKITKVEYKTDDSSWKTKHLLGIDGHQKLEPYQHYSWQVSLHGVGEASQL